MNIRLQIRFVGALVGALALFLLFAAGSTANNDLAESATGLNATCVECRRISIQSSF